MSEPIVDLKGMTETEALVEIRRMIDTVCKLPNLLEAVSVVVDEARAARETSTTEKP